MSDQPDRAPPTGATLPLGRHHTWCALRGKFPADAVCDCGVEQSVPDGAVRIDVRALSDDELDRLEDAVIEELIRRNNYTIPSNHKPRKGRDDRRT